MPRATHKFIYEFLMIFLIVLLCMFGMHYWLVMYSGSAERDASKMMIDTDNLFKVNLFVIDLCVLMITESLLILLFYRFTLPSIGIACIAMVTVLSLRTPIENTRIITRVFSPFLSNKHAFLETSDFILLLMINTVMLAFLVTVLLKESDIENTQLKTEPGRQSAELTKPDARKNEEEKG
jgi:hypothetical protein